MPANESLSVVVPLIYLIVLKIADISREINLIQIQGNEGWVIASPISGFTPIAKLGRFTYLHALNYSILLGTLATIAYVFEGSVWEVLVHRTGPLLTGLLGAFTFLVWFCLPLFEVDEYGDIITEGMPESMAHHTGSVTWTTIYLLTTIHIYNNLTPSPSLMLVVAGVFAIAFSLVYFLLRSPLILFIWIPAVVAMFAAKIYQSKPLPEFTVALGALSMGVVLVVSSFRGIESFLIALDREVANAD